MYYDFTMILRNVYELLIDVTQMLFRINRLYYDFVMIVLRCYYDLITIVQ